MKMPDVILVMRLDIAPIVVRILELPWDEQIGAVNVSRILLRCEHGLVVVAGDRSGYIIGMQPGKSGTSATKPPLSSCGNGSMMTGYSSFGIAGFSDSVDETYQPTDVHGFTG